MKYGICTGPEHIAEAAALGYDYVELAASSIMAMDEAGVQDVKNQLEAANTQAEAFNVLFPGTFRLIQGTPDEEIRAYLRETMRRIGGLGGRTVVFGSGGARRVPEGISYGEAFRRLADVCRMIGDAAAEEGITAAVEPLRYEETNIINTLSEGAALEAAADHPNVRLLADAYHVWCNGEPVSQIQVIGRFAHIHISAVGRGVPVDEELPRYQEFLSALRSAGYDGRISVEARIGDFREEAGKALQVLKKGVMTGA